VFLYVYLHAAGCGTVLHSVMSHCGSTATALSSDCGVAAQIIDSNYLTPVVHMQFRLQVPLL